MRNASPLRVEGHLLTSERTGIGCMLESNRSGEICVSVVVDGGSAFRSGIQEVMCR